MKDLKLNREAISNAIFESNFLINNLWGAKQTGKTWLSQNLCFKAYNNVDLVSSFNFRLKTVTCDGLITYPDYEWFINSLFRSLVTSNGYLNKEKFQFQLANNNFSSQLSKDLSYNSFDTSSNTIPVRQQNLKLQKSLKLKDKESILINYLSANNYFLVLDGIDCFSSLNRIDFKLKAFLSALLTRYTPSKKQRILLISRSPLDLLQISISPYISFPMPLIDSKDIDVLFQTYKVKYSSYSVIAELIEETKGNINLIVSCLKLIDGYKRRCSIDIDFEEFIEDNYGSLSVLLQNTEVLSLAYRAVSNEWFYGGDNVL